MNGLWNRRISIVLLGAMLLSLVACGTEKKTQQEPAQQQPAQQENAAASTEASAKEDPDAISGTITVLTNNADLVETKFAEYKLEFEEKYPGTEVVFESFDQYETAVSTRVVEGSYGDVLYIPKTISNTKLADYFEPLGTLEELSEKYDVKYLLGRQQDGVVYGLAQYAMPQGIVYNKKVFEKAGIVDLPQTPEEFLMALKTIRRQLPDTIPYYTGGEMYPILSQWQQHAWGSVSGDADYHYNGIVTDSAPFSKGTSSYIVYQLLYDIVKEGLCEEKEEGINWNMAEKLLNRGEIGCMLVEWDRIAEIQEAGTNPDDIGYMPFPYNIDGIQYATTTIDSYYAVNKNSENKATAKAWINYMIKNEDYVASEGAVAIGKKAELPKLLQNFKDVELVVDLTPTPENVGEFDRLNEQSGIFIDENKEIQRIVEAARTGEESFDDIMTDWNQRWKEAKMGTKEKE